jgi:hypothetical protein
MPGTLAASQAQIVLTIREALQPVVLQQSWAEQHMLLLQAVCKQHPCSHMGVRELMGRATLALHIYS